MVQCPNCGGYRVTDYDPPAQPPDMLTLVFLGVFTCGLAWIVYWILGLTVEPYKPPADGSHRYGCDLCGNKWKWTPGDPVMPVTVRPDLIAKGAAKLEAEERRRQEGLAFEAELQRQREEEMRRQRS